MRQPARALAPSTLVAGAVIALTGWLRADAVVSVLIGLLISLVVQAKAWTGRITRDHHLTLTVYSYYWHFVDVVWIFVFSSLYLSAHVR